MPEMVFGCADHDIARFLGVMYACDGHVYASDKLWQIGYTTISERLAHDVQHLLLRLGIVSKIRTLKRPVYDGTDKVAREVLITGQTDLRAFADQVRIPGKTTKLSTWSTASAPCDPRRTSTRSRRRAGISSSRPRAPGRGAMSARRRGIHATTTGTSTSGASRGRR